MAKRKLFVISGILIMLALVPLFVKSPYYLDLVIIYLVNGVLAMTFLIMLRTGLISLAIATFWGIGAYASVMLVIKAHLSFWLALPAATLITGVFALILGFILIKNAGFSFILLTMVMSSIFGVLVGNTPLLGGYSGISNIPPPNTISIPFLPPVEFVSKVTFFYLALFLLVLVIMVISAFYSAWTGMAWTAIGINTRLAESLGINIFRHRLLSFVIASTISGLMGSFYVHYQGFITPDTYGLFTTINIQIYAILGGIGYPIAGPLVGSAIMTFFPEFIRVAREVGPVFTGAMLVLVIMLLPNGVVSLMEKPKDAVEQITKIGKILKAWLLSRREKENRYTPS